MTTKNEVRIGQKVYGALTGAYLGRVIAVYGDKPVIRIADDAVTCRNARDISTYAVVVMD